MDLRSLSDRKHSLRVGWGAKTQRKVCVFRRRRIRVNGTLKYSRCCLISIMKLNILRRVSPARKGEGDGVIEGKVEGKRKKGKERKGEGEGEGKRKKGKERKGEGEGEGKGEREGERPYLNTVFYQ